MAVAKAHTGAVTPSLTQMGPRSWLPPRSRHSHGSVFLLPVPVLHVFVPKLLPLECMLVLPAGKAVPEFPGFVTFIPNSGYPGRGAWRWR